MTSHEEDRIRGDVSAQEQRASLKPKEPELAPHKACPKCGWHKFRIEMYSHEIQTLSFAPEHSTDGEWGDHEELIDSIYLRAECWECGTDVTALVRETGRDFHEDLYDGR